MTITRTTMPVTFFSEIVAANNVLGGQATRIPTGTRVNIALRNRDRTLVHVCPPDHNAHAWAWVYPEMLDEETEQPALFEQEA